MSDQLQVNRNTPLPLGKACLTCRRRKIRCDGTRPVCAQCARANRPADCEYTDRGRVTTEILEEEITLLEGHLRELQNPMGGSSIVRLTVPHVSHNAHSASGCGDSMQMKGLIDALQYCTQPSAGPVQVDPKTTHTLILNRDTFREMEPRFLNRAQLSLTQALGNGNLFIRLQLIQAEILLAEYFFALGRFVEGQYHASGAANLTFSAGLHQVQSASRNVAPPRRGASNVGGRSVYFSLPPPRSAREEAERVRLFWAVYNLDKSWSVANDSHSTIIEDGTSGTQINTPWPPEIAVYDTDFAWSAVDVASKTVQEFLSGHTSSSNNGELSAFALRAQVSCLLDCVFNAVSNDHRNVPQINRESMHTLANILLGFTPSLPSLDALAEVPPDKRVLHLVIRSLGHTANIRFHAQRGALSHDAYMKFMASARDIVKIAELMVTNRIDFVDPIIAV
ncbi:hypothetical protein BD410DRAFT_829157 [Rickenella mellea]|uniref:Zn(2)-C6 fungal-type domain-containing protein n=1 Tax=Rickenella mellea TaxID=50990 RepID=A0A4Y7Q3I6_9AGAM|nr:hypothetical protein BD410DRAFT_829157 [Rickenella mellea]